MYYTVETFKHTTDEKLYRETKRDREQTRIIGATSQHTPSFNEDLEKKNELGKPPSPGHRLSLIHI